LKSKDQISSPQRDQYYFEKHWEAYRTNCLLGISPDLQHGCSASWRQRWTY